jgi:hypothetical protein
LAGDPFDFLLSWYETQCDGDWEHQFGVEIATLDNPGWQIKVDLTGTPLESIGLAPQRVDRTDSDWYQIWADGNRFEAACGPLNLREVLAVFESFARREGAPEV